MHWSWLGFNQGSFTENIQHAIYAVAHICIQREMAMGGGLHRVRERESERGMVIQRDGEEDERDKMS